MWTPFCPRARSTVHSISAAITVSASPRRIRIAFWTRRHAGARERELDGRRRCLHVGDEVRTVGHHRNVAGPSSTSRSPATLAGADGLAARTSTVNRFVVDHDAIGGIFAFLETWAVPLFAAATVEPLVPRPAWRAAEDGSSRPPRRSLQRRVGAPGRAGAAAGSGRASARSWPIRAAHVWGSRSQDRVLPVGPRERGVRDRGDRPRSCDQVVGSLFVAAAAVVAVGRVVARSTRSRRASSPDARRRGSAVLVVRLGRPVILAFVRPAERVTDPLVMLLRRLALTRAR